ncbi:hypothetical protein [Pseudochrobactrum asaccharolyticum]|uniref:hypothetical protein n=1 Tax=Pseudochrobactrum asaccharolyticum TaxID=354351 RepID=UPI00404150C4
MTVAENTPQITSLADVPTEFWVAMGIQFFILVFGVWAIIKLIKVASRIPHIIAERHKFSSSKTTPAADNIDDDFADIIEQMKADK